MLASSAGGIWGVEPDESAAISRLYPRSGLYRNDGSTDPLWTYNGAGYFYEENVDVASDGVHLILCNRRASPEHAVSFFANGRLVRSYRVRELSDRPEHIGGEGWDIPKMFVWWKASELSNAKSEYTVRTEDGNTFVFDIRTGKIISESRPGRFWRRVFWGSVALVFAVIAVSIVAEQIRRRRGPSLVAGG